MNNRFMWGKRAMGNNRVTHREYGDIPGILPACDVFVSVPIEEMQAATAARADEFVSLLHAWFTGKDKHGLAFGHREFMNNRFHREDAKLSVIRNPSKPSGKEF